MNAHIVSCSQERDLTTQEDSHVICVYIPAQDLRFAAVVSRDTYMHLTGQHVVAVPMQDQGTVPKAVQPADVPPPSFVVTDEYGTEQG